MYGVIDIGSNSIRLSIYRVEQNQIRLILNRKETAGLAGYLDDRQNLSEQGIRKAIRVLQGFQALLDIVKPDLVFVFATASLRNIRNTAEAVEKIRLETPFKVRVLTGDEEAVFDYFGAVQSVDIEDGLLIDIGGGSTELVFFKSKEVVFTESLPIGSLNLYFNHVSDIIPSPVEEKQIQQTVVRQLKKLILPDYGLSAEKICGVGGTIRASGKLCADLFGGDKRKFECRKIKTLLNRLETDRQGTVSHILKICPDRIHTIVPGMVILKTIFKYYKSQTVTVSPYGVREGYLYYMLQERGELHGDYDRND